MRQYQTHIIDTYLWISDERDCDGKLPSFGGGRMQQCGVRLSLHKAQVTHGRCIRAIN